MDVLMLPFFSDNPYQELLAEGIRGEDIEVTTQEDPLPFTPFIHRIIFGNVDVLHIHWTHPYFLFGSRDNIYRIPGIRIVALLAAFWFTVQVRVAGRFCDRVVWTVHNKHNHEQRFLRIDRWVSRQLGQAVDVVQAWDENTAQEVSDTFEIPRSSIECIPHGNYIPVYDDTDAPSVEEARQELGLQDFDRVFLYFGIIRPYKNVPGLLKAFSKIDSNTCLLIAGNPMNAEVKRNIQELAVDDPRVRLDLRYIPDKEVPKFFTACDAAIFPYKDIFNSGSVVLAMSFGRTFLAPAKGSIQTIAPDENLLYNDLESGLRRLQQKSRRDLQIIGESNLKAAKDNHDWDKISRQTVELYS
ncbi:glycosyltransferase [Halorubrum halophilum]|uniref:glycosyltransferase n=1 Tax=Halorubrum halophilum TaxID=413816 RepID=UPI0009E301C0|nr:glycosyltransferase [Halorubrum halophilum]